MRSRVRAPSSPPANLIHNKQIQEPTYLQQLQLGHIGPQTASVFAHCPLAFFFGNQIKFSMLVIASR